MKPENYPHTIDLDEVAGGGPAGPLIAALAQQAATPRKLDEGIYSVLKADGSVGFEQTVGYELQCEDARRPKPRIVERRMVARDVASFLDVISSACDEEGTYLLGENDGTLEIWADLDKRRVTAILDGEDGWRKHSVNLQLATSPEWRDWEKVDGGLYEQAAFAEFVEDHLSSIGEPDGAQLLDVCQTLIGRVNTNWKQQGLLKNGQVQFQWEENIDAKAGEKGNLAIPSELTLVLRPFLGGGPVLVKARFRFRPSSDGMSLGVRLVEKDRVLEQAFDAVVAQIAADVPVTVRFGETD